MQASDLSWTKRKTFTRISGHEKLQQFKIGAINA